MGFGARVCDPQRRTKPDAFGITNDDLKIEWAAAHRAALRDFPLGRGGGRGYGGKAMKTSGGNKGEINISILAAQEIVQGQYT